MLAAIPGSTPQGIGVMFAVVSHVVFTSGMESKARTELDEEVAPGAQAAPGFNSGIWLISEDGKNGVGIEIFDSRKRGCCPR
jgi:hypothetical protein